MSICPQPQEIKLRPPAPPTILGETGITSRALAQLMRDNPSFKALAKGYARESKLKLKLDAIRGITYCEKESDTNRNRRWDFSVCYEELFIRVESKSFIQGTIKPLGNGLWKGRCMAKSSDKRSLPLEGELEEIVTFCIPKSQFDILAVYYELEDGEEDFLFALASDLPCPKVYSDNINKQLISTSIPISNLPDTIFTHDFHEVCNRLRNKLRNN